MDVFLKPLMEDMKILWETCDQMLDDYRKDSFTLKAIIFVTINDYPALFTLCVRKYKIQFCLKI
jgi:hypothetical protein